MMTGAPTKRPANDLTGRIEPVNQAAPCLLERTEIDDGIGTAERSWVGKACETENRGHETDVTNPRDSQHCRHRPPPCLGAPISRGSWHSACHPRRSRFRGVFTFAGPAGRQKCPGSLGQVAVRCKRTRCILLAAENKGPAQWGFVRLLRARRTTVG